MQSYRTCDYTVGGLYMWRDYFDQRFAIEDGMLFQTAEYLDKGTCFAVPVGSGDFKNAVLKIKEYCEKAGIPLTFCCVTEKGLSELKNIMGEPRSVTEYRDWADYLYPYENFLGYHGKKLVTPRNHCNRFMREFPDFVYEPIDETNVAHAKGFLTENAPALEKAAPLAKEEYVRAVEIMDHLARFGFTGGMLSVNGKIVGVTVGEAVGDTLYVHIEKALREYSGAYPMLASLYAGQNKSEKLLFINREDDSGDPGLRRSKTEYHPSDIIMKYVVEY
ncbi:MAG: phosphatidylglycerol lysyltransferase domain-containing protein [Clostridiales bacterium]|nr:phosphatidylglycerol lysyltransferase domain-containing protein [Clostridiales bacterium]